MNPDFTPFQTPRTQPSTTFKRLAAVTIVSGLCLTLSSCLDEDPSYDREVLKLTAEKSTLQTKLEESQKQLAHMKKEVARLKSTPQAPQPKPTPTAPVAAPDVDQEQIKLGFAKAVSNLSAQIEQKNPDYQVESVTFQKMKMPSDYPFSSGVSTLLVSKSTGTRQTLYWQAQGNSKGEWRFANKGKNNPESDTATAQNPDTTTEATPKPQPKPRPKPTVPADPNSHVIDWGTTLE